MFFIKLYTKTINNKLKLNFSHQLIGDDAKLIFLFQLYIYIFKNKNLVYVILHYQTVQLRERFLNYAEYENFH